MNLSGETHGLPTRGKRLLLISLPVFCALATLWLGILPSRLDRPWEKEEPIRLGETVFWRLLRAGDLQNPRWRDPMDASHPVMTKFVYGAVLEATGHELPRDFAMLDALLGGGDPSRVPAGLESTYERLLIPARRISVVINSLGVGAAAWLAVEIGGIVAAAALTGMLLFHFVFQTHLAKIVSDPLEMMFIVLAGCFCYAWWTRVAKGGVTALWGAAAGAASGAAFVTRLDGLLAFGSVVFVGLVRFWLDGRGRTRVLLFSASALVAFLVVWAGLSPSYWPRGVGALGFVWHLPGGVVRGLTEQVRSLRDQLQGIGPEWRLHSLRDKAAFVVSTIGSGKAGKALVAGLVLLPFRPVRRTLDSSGLRFALVWAGSIVLAFSLWLPVSWSPYFQHVLPEAALLSALGWAGAFRAITGRLRASQAIPVERPVTEGR